VFTIERPVPPTTRNSDETTKGMDLGGPPPSEEVSPAAILPLSPDRRYSLAIILGAMAGQVVQLDTSRVVIGRGIECDLQLADSEVSRRHAMLEIFDDYALLTDLGSTNGTYVEGVRTESSRLSTQQEFTVGSTTMVFIITERHEATPGG
jgi:hypothetical protein